MQLPNTIPLLMGLGHDDTVKMILSNPNDHLQNIVRISKICRVKIMFHCSQSFYITRRKRIDNVTEYVFPEFFSRGGDSLYYKMRRGGRSGFPISLNNIRAFEPVLESHDSFNSYEEFEKKFDKHFITEELIKQLWSEKSSQHGNRYRPSDFRPISSSGKEALRIFLRSFKGINNTDTTTYSEEKCFDGKGTYHICRGYYYGRGGSGSRDIRISHQMGNNLVHYSSEYHNCGNGRYGLLANKSTYLWLEDD